MTHKLSFLGTSTSHTIQTWAVELLLQRTCGLMPCSSKRMWTLMRSGKPTTWYSRVSLNAPICFPMPYDLAVQDDSGNIEKDEAKQIAKDVSAAMLKAFDKGIDEAWDKMSSDEKKMMEAMGGKV